MDLQTRKIKFLQDFLMLESEKAMTQFEKLLKKEIHNTTDLKPMSIVEFHDRIEKATNDSNAGKVTDVDDLLAEIEKWS